MKKLSVLLVMLLCFMLCGCPEENETPPVAKDVHISAGKIEPGMTVKDMFVEVTLDHQPIACRVEFTALTPNGYYIMAEDEVVPEDFLIRLDVYYSLPKGYEVDHINVTMDCDGGEYDGTGSVGNDATGCVEAWSHAIYGEAQEEPAIHPVEVRVLEFASGMTVSQIKVEVTVDGIPVEATVGVTELSDNGMREMDADEKIPEHALLRLNVYYDLEHGITLDDIEVTADFPGGEYDGTGSVKEYEDGRVQAWSHAIYDTLVPEESTTQTTTETTTQAPTEATTQAHVHSWTEQTPDFVFVSCTEDSVKTYTCGCGETRQETVPAPGHDLKDAGTTPPTCTTTGSRVQLCQRCAQGFIEDIPATGHSWSAWEKDTGRVHKRSCSLCGAEETANHNIPSGSVTCTDCGADIVN